MPRSRTAFETAFWKASPPTECIVGDLDTTLCCGILSRWPVTHQLTTAGSVRALFAGGDTPRKRAAAVPRVVNTTVAIRVTVKLIGVARRLTTRRTGTILFSCSSAPNSMLEARNVRCHVVRIAFLPNILHAFTHMDPVDAGTGAMCLADTSPVGDSLVIGQTRLRTPCRRIGTGV